MSVFAEDPSAVHASFITNEAANQGDSNVALVGSNIWQSIAPNKSSSRIPISVTRRRPLTVNESHLRYLQCYAILDEHIEESSIAIPPTWLRLYNHIFVESDIDKGTSAPTLIIALTELIPLTEVIVTALSGEAYRMACDHSEILEDWFADGNLILREGEVYEFTPPPISQINGANNHRQTQLVQYRIDMLDPVLQGRAARGATRFIMTTFDASDLFVEHDSADTMEGDFIEIDEGFLENSVFTPGYPSVSLDASQGSLVSYNTPHRKSSGDFTLRVLQSPISAVEDHFTLYLRTMDLARLGILNGDWAVAGSSFCPGNRLVRVIANDEAILETGSVLASPVLLHNIHQGPDKPSTTMDSVIHIYPSPFGSRPPVIPTARSATIARIASPLTINRVYQSTFLSALKSFFDASKRLLKKGDIIAIPLDTDISRQFSDSESDTKQNNCLQPRRPNELAFFLVTNIEHDVLGSQSSGQDIYSGATLGELGCWIDPATTRIIQTGVENIRIPDSGTYFYQDDNDPRTIFSVLSRRSSSCLLGNGGLYQKILSLSSAGLTKGAADYNLPLALLLKGSRGIGKYSTLVWVAQKLGLHVFEVNCYDVLGESDARTEATLRVRFEQARSCSPCILVLRHLEALSQTTQKLEKEPAMASTLRECMEDIQRSWKVTGYPVIIAATISDVSRTPSSILSCFKHEFMFEAPAESERKEILECLLARHSLAPDVSLSSIATQTAALIAADLHDLVERAKHIAFERTTTSADLDLIHVVHAGFHLTDNDFDVALGKARASYSESIGAPKIPTVSWDDVGGLAHVKTDILDTIQLPLEHPELFVDGLKKRSGILLYGPPGTGKTLVAKAVATSCSLNFFSVKGPELLNMYIGESEANVRRVFQRARDAKPCVIFFDELDSVAPKRGNHGDSGGVMDRIVSQLLAELDGMSSGGSGTDVFVIGATNRPDLLDPALLRPGRFDRMLYLGVSETHEAQLNILEALTRKFRLDPDLDLREIAERCPFNYTGADFYALCSDAMLNAMSRKAEDIEVKIEELNKTPGFHAHPYPLTPQYFLAELASEQDISVLVSRSDFDRALRSLVPSVSQAEMEHYSRIQEKFSKNSVEQAVD